jgi:hypothetical protein
MKNPWTQYLDAALCDGTKAEHHERQHPSSGRYQVRTVFAVIRAYRQILWDRSVARSSRGAEHLACFGRAPQCSCRPIEEVRRLAFDLPRAQGAKKI